MDQAVMMELVAMSMKDTRGGRWKSPAIRGFEREERTELPEVEQTPKWRPGLRRRVGWPPAIEWLPLFRAEQSA